MRLILILFLLAVGLEGMYNDFTWWHFAATALFGWHVRSKMDD